MIALIDELRKTYREIIKAERSFDDLLTSSKCHQAIRERFERKIGLIDGVRSPLPHKKKREASLLLRFLLAYEQLPARRIFIGEHPDFRFSVGRTRVGIELTKAFVSPWQSPIAKQRGNVIKEQESLQDRIVQKAMQFHKQQGGAPARVNITFRNSAFCKSEVDDAAETLGQLVPRQSVPGSLRVTKRCENWPIWLSDVQIIKRPACLQGQGLANWDAVHFGAVYAAEDVLPQIILEKEDKLASYRHARCDEYWLLIYVDGQAPSSFIELRDVNHLFTTNFDKVFLFSPTEDSTKRIVKLNCHRPIGGAC